MSKQANPLAIGAFLTGALVLLTTAVLVFGGGDFFKKKKLFVIFFDSALNGLNLGAPVKLQGVQIGDVAEISLEMDPDTGRIYKPVVIEIEPELLQDFSAPVSAPQTDGKQQQDAKRLIELGLKARLETQSLLTGLLYVDLDFYQEKPVYLVEHDFKNLPQLPSVPTTVDEIRNIADEIISKVRELPLEEMIRDLSETLEETRNILKSEEMKQSLAATAKTLQETQKLLATLNTQAGPLLTNLNETTLETRTNIKDLNKQLIPVLKAAEQSLNAATLVLQDSKQTLHAMEDLVTPDSPLGQALLEMRNASRSLRELSDTLERQPNSIIFGK